MKITKKRAEGIKSSKLIRPPKTVASYSGDIGGGVEHGTTSPTFFLSGTE